MPKKQWQTEFLEQGTEKLNIDCSALIFTVSEIREKAKRELLIEVLSDFNKSQLENKGYDFFFVLRNKLDELNRPKE